MIQLQPDTAESTPIVPAEPPHKGYSVNCGWRKVLLVLMLVCVCLLSVDALVTSGLALAGVGDTDGEISTMVTMC